MARDVQVSAGGVYDLGYQIVWCPKYRRPVLGGAVGARCGELIRVKCDEHGWQVIAVEVMPDHVHLFVKAQPKDSPLYVANQLKGYTCRLPFRPHERPEKLTSPGVRGVTRLSVGAFDTVGP